MTHPTEHSAGYKQGHLYVLTWKGSMIFMTGKASCKRTDLICCEKNVYIYLHMLRNLQKPLILITVIT